MAEKLSLVDMMKRRQSEGEHNPLTATLELTHVCNLRCCHCYLEHQLEGNDLSTGQWKSFIDQAAELGAFFASFTGGEIFCRRDFLELAEYALAKGIFFQFQTNGTYIDGEMAEHIRRLQPTKVEISLYGPNPEVHDAITGVDGSFEKTVTAMRLLRERNIYIFMKTSVMPQNMEHIAAMRKLADELGVWIMVDPIIMPGVFGSEKTLAHRMDNHQYRHYMISENWGTTPGKELENIRDDINRPDRRVLCTAAKKRFTITAVGEVIPCPIWRYSCGSLLEHGLEEIWQGEPMSTLRALKFEDLKQCQKCETYESCTRCAGLAYMETGDYTACPQESSRVSGLLHELRKENQSQQD